MVGGNRGQDVTRQKSRIEVHKQISYTHDVLH